MKFVINKKESTISMKLQTPHFRINNTLRNYNFYTNL